MSTPVQHNAESDRKPRQTFSRLRLALLSLSFAAVIGACGSTQQARQTEPTPRTVLVVENRGFADMRIYMVDGGRRVRVGIAPGHRTTELVIPNTLAATTGMIRFLSEPIGGTRASLSNDIPIQPGKRMTLVIPPA